MGEADPTRAEEGAVLLAVGQALSLNVPPEEAMRRVAREVARAFGADMVGFYTVGRPPDGLLPVAGYHVPPDLVDWFRTTALHVGTSPSLTEAWTTRRPAWTTDASRDARWPPAARAHLPPHAAVFGPMAVREEVIGGLFLVWWKTGRNFTDAEVRLLQGVTSQVGLVLANVDLARTATARAQKLKALSKVTRLITESPSSQSVFHAIAMAAATLLGARLADVWIESPGRRTLRLGGRFTTHPGAEALLPEISTIPAGRGITGRVLDRAEPQYVEDVQQHPRFLHQRLAAEMDLHGYAGLPLVVGSRALGVLTLFFHERRHFAADEIELMSLLADHAALAIRNAQMLEREQQGRAEVEASEERYRLLFARNVAGIFRATADGRMLECNDAFARMLGYASRAEALARPVTAFYADPGQHARLAARLAPGQCYAGLEVVLRRRDGSERWALMNLLAARDGDADCLEGTLIDVTDRKRAEEAERRTEALRSVTSLAVAAAHEINNPLAALLAAVELMARKLPSDSPLRAHTDRMIMNIGRIMEIVDRMSHITRLEPTREWGSNLPEMLDLRRSSPRPDPDRS